MEPGITWDDGTAYNPDIYGRYVYTTAAQPNTNLNIPGQPPRVLSGPTTPSGSTPIGQLSDFIANLVPIKMNVDYLRGKTESPYTPNAGLDYGLADPALAAAANGNTIPEPDSPPSSHAGLPYNDPFDLSRYGITSDNLPLIAVIGGIALIGVVALK